MGTDKPRSVLAVVLLVLLVAVGTTFAYVYLTDGNTISSRNTRIDDLEAQLGNANSTISTDASKISSDTTQISNLNSQINSDSSTIASYQQTINNDASQIETLQSQVSSDTTSINSLESQVSSDQTQISSLQSQVSSDQTTIDSLESQVSSLQSASLAGSFSSTTSVCGIVIDCSYTINGAYANYGTDASGGATVTFTFYSGSGATGQTLCSTTVVLGSVLGRSVSLLPQTTCSSSSTTAAASFTWSFSS